MRDKPKLYALIIKHLSDESMEAIQKEVDWMTTEVDENPEALCHLGR
jgi:hypothetical protein